MSRRVRCLLVVVALALGACGETLEGKFGEELYRAGCARCHADDGSGGIGPAIGTPNANAALMLTDDQIRAVIRVGPGRMPSFDRLTDEQVDSLVDHLRTLQSGVPDPAG